MDKALYVAMTGARASLQAQGVVANNLANVDTSGFKAALAGTQQYKVQGAGFASRIDATLMDPGFNASVGMQRVTGRNTDVALTDGNWLAVQGSDGKPAYTRGGELTITPNGQLVTAGGRPVLDDNQVPIAVPPYQSVDIGSDGTISIVPQGEAASTMVVLGRMRVVQLDRSQIARGSDGLMRTTDPNLAPPPSAGNVLTTGALEGSNVSAPDTLVQMIQLQRQYEMQVKVIKTGDEDAQSANGLLRLNG